jgi:hypothetical protein
VIEKAKATVSWLYLAVNDSCASSKETAAPSDFTGAVPNPVNSTSSSKDLSEFSVSNRGVCSSFTSPYSTPNTALSPGRSCFAILALFIALLYLLLYAVA